MILRRNHTLQYLCFFLCKLCLTDAHCFDILNSKNWEENNITFGKLTERITLVNAQSFKDIIKCTLKNKGKDVDHLLYLCMNYSEGETLNCGETLQQSVSFFDLMCFVAKETPEMEENPIQACSHDVVVELYDRFNLAPFTTPLPTTKQPPKTTTLTTTTAKSTTAEKSAQTNPSVTTWSTTPAASGTALQSPDRDISQNHGITDYNKLQTNKVVTENIFYSLFGLSVLMNLVLAFGVALLWSWRRSSRGVNVMDAAEGNGHATDNQHLVLLSPIL